MKKISIIIILLIGLLFIDSNIEDSIYNYVEPVIPVEEIIPEVIERLTVCLDPGHQAEGDYSLEPISPNSEEMKARVSSGTVGVESGVYEYELVLEISMKLKKKLEENDYNVVMTRETHDVNISNSERAQIANNSQADLFIRIHADQRADSSVRGISILCPEVDDDSMNIYANSKIASEIILASLIAETNANNMGISYRDDISGFNWSEVPVLLVELGFMSNSEEDLLLNESNYQEKLVDGLYRGIEKYFEMME